VTETVRPSKPRITIGRHARLLAKDGWVFGAPNNGVAIRDSDACGTMRCEECGRGGMVYVPYFRHPATVRRLRIVASPGEARDLHYRAYAVCPDRPCGTFARIS
jgi:hypothetical protein